MGEETKLRSSSSRLWSRVSNDPVLSVLVVVFLLLLVLILATMFCEPAVCYLSGLLGLDSTVLQQKNEILKTLAIVMGGVILVVQARIAVRRAKAMENAADAQARATQEMARTNESTEKGLRQERMKVAIEHMASRKDSVRMGGIVEFHHLAQDTPYLRQTAVDIFCAHIRRVTNQKRYKSKHESEPSEEIQTLLTLMFVDSRIYDDCDVSLTGSWLNGANLVKARLRGAVLGKVNLQGANLESADLRQTDLRDARLQGARLWSARLQETNLACAYLQGANLMYAQLQLAHLEMAQLQGSVLAGASLQGANLASVLLQGASLGRSGLQGAYLSAVHLQGASSQPWPGVVSFSDRISGSIDRETDLAGAVLQGGIRRKDSERLSEGLRHSSVETLRDWLRPHVDEPKSCEIPDNSAMENLAADFFSRLMPELDKPPAPPPAAFTGAYGVEKASIWIAEYPKWIAERESAAAKADMDLKKLQKGDG